MPAQHDNPHEASRQHGVPQAIPGLHLSTRFAGVGCPSLGGLGQGLGRANQGTFFAWGAASLGYRLGRQLIKLGADRQSPDDVGALGQLPDVVLRSIATIGQAPEGAPGGLRGNAIEGIARAN